MPVTSIIQSAAAGGWTPDELFTGGEQGAWYDPSDLSTLWQDTAGTTPVTTHGDVVRRMDDLSGNGNHFTTTASTWVYQTDGTYHWLLFAGTSGQMTFPDVVDLRGAGGIYVAVALLSSDTDTNGGAGAGVIGKWGSGTGWALLGNEFSSASIGRWQVRANFSNLGINTVGDVTDGNPHVFGGMHNASTVSMGLDGAWSSSGTISSLQTSSTAVALGTYEASGGWYLAMRFYAGILLDRAPTTDERDNADAWLAGKNGATL